MTRHGGGGFSGGGGGGGGFGGHGRSSGGSFGPPPPSQHHHPPPPPPHHHRHAPPIYYGPPPIFYSPGPLVGGGAAYQMPPPAVIRPPPAVIQRMDRRTRVLNRSKAIFTFLMFVLLIGTIWLYFGPYGSDVIELGVHDSRLITAQPFFVKNIKFKNRYEMDGPRFYAFDHKPPLNQESSWLDSQNETFSHGHEEFFYWMNKGSTVTVSTTLVVAKKLESVYLAMVKATPEHLQAYYDKPRALAKPLSGHDVLQFEVKEDADYAFSLMTLNPENVTVFLDFRFRTREYSTVGAIEQYSLKTNSKIGLSFFRSEYALLTGPGSDKIGVDVWEIELSYGTRWTAIIFIYGLVTLVYLVTKFKIMMSIHEMDPSLPEYAPLVSQESQTTVPAPAPVAPSAPSAPIASDSVLAEEDSSILKEKGKDTEKEVPEDKLCSVCLDAPKDSFFVPCGHRATCFSCGLRISLLDPPNCPICRQPISDVKKIYDA